MPMRLNFLFPLNLDFEDFYIISEYIPDALTLLGILVPLVSLFILAYSTFRPKKSDVIIGYQFEGHGAVIRQQNRIDIDLFLYVENKGELTGKIEFFAIGENIQFKNSTGTTTVNRSKFEDVGQNITYHSLDGNTLSPGDASSVTVRFMFSKDDQLSELLSQYEEMEIPWKARVTEAERKYTIDGVATLNFPAGGVRFPPPTSINSEDN